MLKAVQFTVKMISNLILHLHLHLHLLFTFCWRKLLKETGPTEIHFYCIRRLKTNCKKVYCTTAYNAIFYSLLFVCMYHLHSPCQLIRLAYKVYFLPSTIYQKMRSY